MIVRVHLVNCDMPDCESQLIPHNAHTARAARTSAAEHADWRRIRIAASPGTPAWWADVCPKHHEPSA